MDLGEVLPLELRQGSVDQRQPVGLLVGQVRGQLGGELVDDVTEPLVAVIRVGRGEPALLAYVEHYRAGVERQVTECLAGKLGLDPRISGCWSWPNSPPSRLA
jgi:hypothetical protein